ncbi:MAG: spondin domain-containing protein, partial [Phycisphaerales bacterium]|nr:spondin domain-containing protein [Phycisphaerales bacterium]
LAPGGGLENVAEDGTVSVIGAEFAASEPDGLGGVILAPAGFPGLPVFDPQDSGNAVFDLDPNVHRFFSFASMVIPSNDAFIANPRATRHELFDEGGEFQGPIVINVRGSQVWDAGTEANTEMQAAFFNQAANNTGVTTFDPVLPHPGFIGSNDNPGGSPIILGGISIMPPGIFFDPIAADFSLPGYKVARITIELVEVGDDDSDD